MDKFSADENNVQDSSENKKSEDEDIADLLGPWGKWQVVVFAIIFYRGMPAAWSNLGFAFTAPSLDHWCGKPVQYANMSTDEWKNYSLPKEFINGEISYSQCKMYNVSSSIEDNRTVIPCVSWEYDHSFYKATIVEKWDLVCEWSWLASFVKSLYFLGYLISMFVAGQLSDRFGRKKLFYLCIAWTIVFGIICTFSQHYWLYAISKFLFSITRSATYIVLYVLAMELVSKEHRILVGLISKAGWALGQMILPGLVWLYRDWFYLDLSSALPYILVLPLWWLTPESPRWLFSQGRIKEAKAILLKGAKMKKLNEEIAKERVEKITKRISQENKKNDLKKATFIDIMKTHNLRRISLMLYFIWVANVLSYYGLSFTADDIGVDVLLFFFLSALVEIPAALIFYFLQPRIGRIFTQSASMLVTGLCCLFAIAVPKNIPGLLTALAVISKFGLSVSFASMYLLSSEVYPTVVRNVGLGFCSMMGRIGAIVAPFMKEAGLLVHPAFPLGLFGSICILGAMLTLFLPETNNLKLADTLEEGEIMTSHTLRLSDVKRKLHIENTGKDQHKNPENIGIRNARNIEHEKP